MWSPLTVEMVGHGSDAHVVAGQPGRVVVVVVGEDDGTVERITVQLELTGEGQTLVYPLGEAPLAVGRHELDLTMPTGLPPSAAGFTTYWLKSTLIRTKGQGSSAMCPVFVIARAEDCPWPAARSGREGAGSLAVALDSEIVDIGKTLTGRITGAAAGEPVQVALVSTQTGYAEGKDGRELQTTDVEVARLDVDGEAFTIDVPAGVVPTLAVGNDTTVFWQVRGTSGTTTAWTIVGVLDPDALAAVNERETSSLSEFLS